MTSHDLYTSAFIIVVHELKLQKCSVLSQSIDYHNYEVRFVYDWREYKLKFIAPNCWDLIMKYKFTNNSMVLRSFEENDFEDPSFKHRVVDIVLERLSKI